MRPLIDHHLRAQLGLVTRSQLRDAGVSGAVLGRLRRDELDPVFPAVFRHRSHRATPTQAALAAVLQFGRGAVASHRCAAVLHGLSRVRMDHPEVTLPDRRRAAVAGVIVHRHPGLLADECTVVGEVPTTTPARTLVDLGAVVGPGTVARALEQWLADRAVSVEEVWACLGRHRHEPRPGPRTLARVLAVRGIGTTVADSVPEADLGHLLARAGLPVPVHHHTVRLRSGRVVEFDWAYPDRKIALEVDGYGVHLRSAVAFADDRDRLNQARLEGWLVLQFAASTTRRRPQRVVTQVAAALAARPG